MKKFFIYSIVILSVFASVSCQNEDIDLLFDDSAAERLNAASDLYSSRLMAQPNGWAMQLYPTLEDEAPYGTGYLVLMRFNKDNSVDAAMNNSLSDNKYITDTSAWDIITDDGPVLTFNTYNNVIHTFSNPEDYSTDTKIGQTHNVGVGIGGDYEFIIVDAPDDASYMMLKGKKRATYNLLTPIEEGVDYEEYLTDVKAFHSKMFSSSSPTYDLMHYGDSICRFEDANDGVPAIYPLNGDAVTQSTFNPFVITKRGNDYYLRFRDAKTFGDVTIQDFKYDTDKDEFVSVDNDAFYLEGNDLMSFFKSSLKSRHAFTLTRDKTEMSESVKTAIDNVYTTYHSIKSKYGVTTYSLCYDTDGNFLVKCRYNQSDSNTELKYIFNVTINDDGTMKLEYSKPANTSSENHFARVQEVIEGVFSQTFKVSAMTTRFNLGSMKLTSTTNPDCWFEITY